MRQKYDFIMLDCPPHLGIIPMINALVASDLLIIPIQTDFLALHGLKLLFDTLHYPEQGFAKTCKLQGNCDNVRQKDQSVHQSVGAFEKIKLAGALFSTIVGVDTHFREASARGCSIFRYRRRDPGARQLINPLAGEVVALW